MAKTVDVIVETGKDLFGCFIAKGYDDLSVGFVGDGATARSAIEDFRRAYEEAKDVAARNGESMPELEFRFIFDVGAFFSYYPLSITAFAKYIGMNASLLRQYASGLKTPSAKTLAKIRSGFERVGRDIEGGMLVDKPVMQYV